MKKSTSIFVLATVLLIACNEEAADLQQEQIQFTFNTSSLENDGGRVGEAEIPEGSHLLLSLTDDAGNEVFTHKKISILSFGEGNITEPLALKPGPYHIADFMIVNEAGAVLFATPKKGSPLAKTVSRPLPSRFTVGRNNLKNVEMEVIKIGTKAPEDFGYASFGIDVVHPFRIAVFFPQDGQLVLTKAKAMITREGESYEYTLGAFVNLISFHGDPNALYLLTVTKEGWGQYQAQEFRYSSIAATEEPLEILLPEAYFSISAESKYDGYGVTGEMSEPGTLSASWGFGPDEKVKLDAGPFDFWREIPEAGPIGMRITGDIDKISVIETHDIVDDFYGGYLTGLKKLYFALNGAQSVDLSNSNKLEYLVLRNFSSEVILPENHNINYIDLSYSIPHEVDHVIGDIYHNTVARNIRGGTFLLEYISIVPTTESLEKLDELKNTYGWTVSYIFRE